MRDLAHAALPLLICLSLVAGSTPAADSAAAQAAEKAKKYVCAPCGMPCDEKVYDQPGDCPVCGAGLIEQGATKASVKARKKAAILIFQGVQIIDYTGPYEVFGQAGFDVFTVAESMAPLTTSMGMTVVPKYTFADAPKADVLVVPGGNVDGPRASAAALKWVKDQTASAEHTMSVCNGAFILASGGLLDGLSATTFYRLIDTLKTEAPKTKVVSDRRYVDNGKIITTAGLSSGIDGSLHVVSEMLGNGSAQAVALNMEYDWRPDSGYARAALADRQIPSIRAELDSIGDFDFVSTEGGTDRWEIVVRGSTDLSAAELLDHLGHTFADKGKWSSVQAASASSSPARSDWKFNGRDGKPWTGTLSVEAVAGRSRWYTVKLNIARVG